MPRSAIMITKSLRLNLKLVYQLTQRMMIWPSKCRPLNSASIGPKGRILPSSAIGSVCTRAIPRRSAVAVRSRIAWLKVDCASQIADTSIQIPHRKSSKASIEPGGREGFIERDRETEIGNGPLQFLFRQPLITALDIRHRRSGSSLAAAQLH